MAESIFTSIYTKVPTNKSNFEYVSPSDLQGKCFKLLSADTMKFRGTEKLRFHIELDGESKCFTLAITPQRKAVAEYLTKKAIEKATIEKAEANNSTGYTWLITDAK